MTSLFPAVYPPLRDLAGLAGRVITPGHSDYDKTRAVFYGDIDKRPSAIVRVANTEDVQRAVATAQREGYELAIRSGGHSPVGGSTTDGGLVIDLREMRAIDIDVDARTAWIETGATALQVTEALSKPDLVIGFGDAGSVGVGGITLGGGMGYLVRKFGMTIDSVLAAEIVTADGRVRYVDSRHEPDLFFAIRGGGGNFGVVTRILFRLNPLRAFTGGLLILPATAETIATFTATALAAPEDLSTIANILCAPPLPFLPTEMHGSPVIFANIAYAGDDDSATQAIAPFRAIATPLADMVKPAPYLSMYPAEDPNRRPTMITRTMFVDSIDTKTAETMHKYLSTPHPTMRAAQLRVLGGAMARVPEDATAFAHRGRPILINVSGAYNGDLDRRVQTGWATEFANAIQPRDNGAYVGFLSDDGRARIRSAYPGRTWNRLAGIKSTYDPTNLFRLNHNISPAEP
jgi:FAD binding domain/Berberine and berberine like